MAREFVLEVNLDNAGFEVSSGRGLATILRDLARRVEELHHSEITGGIFDDNGNLVGSYSLIYEPDELDESEQDGQDEDILVVKDAGSTSSAVVFNPKNSKKKAKIPLPFPDDAAYSLRVAEHLESPLFCPEIAVESVDSVVDRCEAVAATGSTLINIERRPGEVFSLDLLHRKVEAMSQFQLEKLRAMLWADEQTITAALGTVRSIVGLTDKTQFHWKDTLVDAAERRVKDACSEEGYDWLEQYVDIKRLVQDLKADHVETPWGVIHYPEK